MVRIFSMRTAILYIDPKSHSWMQKSVRSLTKQLGKHIYKICKYFIKYLCSPKENAFPTAHDGFATVNKLQYLYLDTA